MALTTNKSILSWIDEKAELVKPDSIVWIDGSDEQRDVLRAEACSTGEMIKLNEEKCPGCYLHRTAVNDVARVEGRTFICTRKKEDAGNWGLGWWRQGDGQRVWYFGTQASSGTIGHQGWTGTMVMVDPSRQLVIVYLTNKINSPVTSPDNSNRFNGNYYTASTLGFVPQLLSVGLDETGDIKPQLTALLADMAIESTKLVSSIADASHPSMLNAVSKLEVLRAWAENDPHWLAVADEIEAVLNK